MKPRRLGAVAWGLAGALGCAAAPHPVSAPHIGPAEPGVSAAPAAPALAAPALAARGLPRLPHVDSRRLPNGMAVLIAKRATPVATLALSVRHASAAAQPQPSAARSLEQLMAAVSPASGSSLLDAIEERGGSVQLETARDHSLLSTTVLTSDVGHSLEQLGALVRASTTDTPRLQPSDTALIVVGNVQPEQVARQVGALFEPWGDSPTPRHRKPEPTPPAPRAAGPRIVIVDRPGATESTLVTWQPMPARSEPGHEAREVMAQALGGLFSSRLNLSLRERHTLSYGCWARLLAGGGGGTLLVSTRVPTLRTAEALREVMLELQAVSDAAGGHPFTGEEIETAKRRVLMELELQAEHAAGIVALLSATHAAELPWDALADHPARLSRVDVKAVQREAGRLDPRAMTVVITGNRAHIEAEIHVVVDALSRRLASERAR